MTISIDELISKSGDSELVKYTYSNGRLSIEIELDELDKLGVLGIFTNTISSDCTLKESLSSRTCYMVLVEVNNVLNVKNGYYVPPAQFSTLMKHEREGINLAYGKKNNQVKYVFQIRNSEVLLACLVKNKEDIDIKLKV